MNNEQVFINVKALHDNQLIENYTENTIVAEYGQTLDEVTYNLYNEKGELACCDGEECTIVTVEDDFILLVNTTGDKTVCFALTYEEFKIATKEN